jgi:hypothetical protein
MLQLAKNNPSPHHLGLFGKLLPCAYALLNQQVKHAGCVFGEQDDLVRCLAFREAEIKLRSAALLLINGCCPHTTSYTKLPTLPHYLTRLNATSYG